MTMMMSGVVCFTDVVGMHFEADESSESHPASSYHDSKATVGDANILAKFSVVDASDQSYCSYITAEEMIKCASETAVLKQLSESLVVTSGSEVVSSADIPYRDSEIDGAEDICEQSEALSRTETEFDVQSKAAECSAATDRSYSAAASLTQKTVAVAALPSGVYITKPPAATDKKASRTLSGEDVDCDRGLRDRDRRRLQLHQQLPILHDLDQRP